MIVKRMCAGLCRCMEYTMLISQWVGWSLSYFWLLFLEIPHLVPNHWLNLAVTTLAAMIMVCFFRSLWLLRWEASCSFVPTGKLERKEENHCDKCGALRLSRDVHHCSTCQRCVYRMDHHCICIASCVSAYNYPYFVSYIFLGWITAINFSVSTLFFLWFYLFEIVPFFPNQF